MKQKPYSVGLFSGQQMFHFCGHNNKHTKSVFILYLFDFWGWWEGCMGESGAWPLPVKLPGETVNCLHSFSPQPCSSNLDTVFPRGPCIAALPPLLH